MRKKDYVGKIGYCDNKFLNIRDKNGNVIKGGHYVYIRDLDGNKCDVNIITSLEDKNGNYIHNKINKIKNGYLYPLPKKDTNFSRWSAINLTADTKKVNINQIQNVGEKYIKHRHKFFVGKFTKK